MLQLLGVAGESLVLGLDQRWMSYPEEAWQVPHKKYYPSPYTPYMYATILRDAWWIGGLTKVMIYPTCAIQHQKIAVLAILIPNSSGSRVVSYPFTCKQQKQTNLGCLGCPGALTAEQRTLPFKVVISLLERHQSSHKRGFVVPHEV